MPTQTIEATLAERRYKMQIKQHEFMPDRGGHLEAGAVLITDEETALRWMEQGIATPAAADALTHREQKRADLLAELERLEAEGPQPGVYNAAISRASFYDETPPPERPIMPPAMPNRRGRRDRATLTGAEVMNAQRTPLADIDAEAGEAE